MTSTQVAVVDGRSCAGCTMCCKLLRVEALDKPANTWCASCIPGSGCRIHDTKPFECTDFYCGYLTLGFLDERWKPVHSKMIIAMERGVNRVVIHIDPGRPGAWRQEPYHSQIRKWARDGFRENAQVLLICNEIVTVVFPVGEKTIGRVTPTRAVKVVQRMTPDGPVYDALVIDREG